jgi:hypothetical protein
MNTTRRDFGMTIATLARLYREAEGSGDTRRAKVYAAAVDVLLDAWPSEQTEPGVRELRERGLGVASSSEEGTLIGLGDMPDQSAPSPLAPVSGLHRKAHDASGPERKERKRKGAR